MTTYLLKNAFIINKGTIKNADVLIRNGKIEKIDTNINFDGSHKQIDLTGKYLIPGIIDDQVHFREPGLTHKANIATESRAAAAGGVTTFMEMPNTKPGALTQALLQDKYDIAANTAFANYSFFMGVSNDNYEEVMRTDAKNICGLKIFMGSSTGNMLVDDAKVLEKIFANTGMLIATHCEDEKTIIDSTRRFVEKHGDQITPAMHPLIRSEEACYLSSSFAVSLAQQHDTRLHILHISSRDELPLFSSILPLKKKRITTEVCVHHLYFDADDYETLGNLIKCNPAIKAKQHRVALLDALLDDTIDIIATDHAPHTWEEKDNPYLQSPSGLPLVQHSLQVMLDFYHQGKISLEKIVEKMCHAPADCFLIEDRGYIQEGYHADLVVLDLDKTYKVSKENILYKCGWSPLEGKTFKGEVTHTFINGGLAYEAGVGFQQGYGQRITFDR